ncbi:hypothetical protein G7054_g11763 [Neopestalotiopsis clavispora]|nr:hypothetical protein G7054_g11763 [Neopestalotiopsis clavispora]
MEPIEGHDCNRGPLPLSMDYICFLKHAVDFPDDMPLAPMVAAAAERINQVSRSIESQESYEDDESASLPDYESEDEHEDHHEHASSNENESTEEQQCKARHQPDISSCPYPSSGSDFDENRKHCSLTETPQPEGVIHKIDSEEFLSDFEHIFDVEESPNIAGGLIVIAKTAEASLAYADNAYNSADPSKSLIIWTDASWVQKYPERLACAASTLRKDPSKGTFHDRITLMRGPLGAPYELFGIRQALQVAMRYQAGHHVVKLFTDCQTAMKVILSTWKDFDPDVGALLKDIGRLSKELVERGSRLELHWCKAHNGVPENERVDTLAASTRRAFQSHRFHRAPSRMEYEALPDLEQDLLLDGREEAQRALNKLSSSHVFEGRRLR